METDTEVTLPIQPLETTRRVVVDRRSRNDWKGKTYSWRMVSIALFLLLIGSGIWIGLLRHTNSGLISYNEYLVQAINDKKMDVIPAWSKRGVK